MKKTLDHLAAQILQLPTPRVISLSSASYRNAVTALVEQIESLTASDVQTLRELFVYLRKKNSSYTLLLAIKLALSYASMPHITKPLCVSVVFAIYNERNRLHRSKEHQHGENFLRAKIQQLNQLFNRNPRLRWRLVIVDDGSIDGSAHIVQFILEGEYRKYLENKQIQVVFMKDALQKKLPYLQPATSLQKSGKGSSILYGLDVADRSVTLKANERHVLVYTDADLSVDLRQLGNILHQMIEQKCDAVIGERRLPDSVMHRTAYKSGRGKLYIFLLKQILPQLKGMVTDPQAPLKAFDAQLLPLVLKSVREPGFSYDVDFLLTLWQLSVNTCHAGICFTDSDDESHTRNELTHFKILKDVIQIRKRYFPRKPLNPEYEALIESMSDREWPVLVANIPPEIKRAPPHELEKLDIPAESLKKLLRK